MARLEALQDVLQCGARHFGINAAQGIVCAEFKDHALRAGRHRPVEPVETAGCGIAGDAGIADRDVQALVFQDFSNCAGNAAAAESPRPALKESPSTTILAGPSAVSSAACAGTAMAMPALSRIHAKARINLSTAVKEMPYEPAWWFRRSLPFCCESSRDLLNQTTLE